MVRVSQYNKSKGYHRKNGFLFENINMQIHFLLLQLFLFTFFIHTHSNSKQVVEVALEKGERKTKYYLHNKN